MNFPLTYLVFKLGMPVYTAWIIRIIVQLITFIVRCSYLEKNMNFPILIFLKDVIKPIILVSIICIPFPVILTIFSEKNLINLVIIVGFSMVYVLFTIYFIGLTKSEKSIVKEYIFRKFLHKNK